MVPPDCPRKQTDIYDSKVYIPSAAVFADLYIVSTFTMAETTKESSAELSPTHDESQKPLAGVEKDASRSEAVNAKVDEMCVFRPSHSVLLHVSVLKFHLANTRGLSSSRRSRKKVRISLYSYDIDS